MQTHFTGLDLREVQNIVDQGQQVFAGRLNFLQIPHHGRFTQFLCFLFQHLAVPNNQHRGVFAIHDSCWREKLLLARLASSAARFALSNSSCACLCSDMSLKNVLKIHCPPNLTGEVATSTGNS